MSVRGVSRKRLSMDMVDALKMRGGEFRSCLTKKAYNSEKGARMAIEFNPEKAGTRFYKCENCGKWHTTRQPLERRKLYEAAEEK